MNADGSGQTRITNTPNPVQNVDPAWSPDGKQIAFFSDRDNPGIEEDLWIMNADGSSPRQLTFNTVVDFSVDWAPDGSRLVFSQDVPGGTGNLWLINSDGSGLRQLSFFTVAMGHSEPTSRQTGPRSSSPPTRPGIDNDPLGLISSNGGPVRAITSIERLCTRLHGRRTADRLL